MKRQYEKPLIAIEHYELTQSIAACSRKIGFLNSQCVINDPDATTQMKSLAAANWFTNGYCAKSVIEGSDENGICYHTNLNSAFNS